MIHGAVDHDLDVYVCYAGEDQAKFAQPLVDELIRRGVRVWYDRQDIGLGDDVRTKMDDGLRRARYCVALLSHSFFKYWTSAELSAVLAREKALRRKVLLPILCDLSVEDLSANAPLLGSRAFAAWSDGLEHVVERIIRELRHGELPHTPPASDDSAAAQMRSRVELQTKRHRRDLAARTLTRIQRAAMTARYDRLRERLRAGSAAVHFITGEAGCGKSTTLGEVHDAAVAWDVAWCAVVPCDALRLTGWPTVDDLDREVGRVACGGASIHDACRILSGAFGRGLLLVDTLDIILTRDIALPLINLLDAVVASGVSVVATCRHDEFVAHLKSKVESPQDIWPLGPFERSEMAHAARLFAARWNPSDEGEAFARSLETLAAGEQRLDEIARQPLMLSMLCELFAEDGHVPPDLTVAGLYRRYWAKKVESSRVHGPTSAMATLKVRLCLRIAAAANGRRMTRVVKSDVVAAGEEAEFAELQGERVVQPLADGWVEFFHQSFLEYATARWLCTADGAPRLDAILASVRGARDDLSDLEHWPVLRQYLAIVDRDQYARVVNDLPLERIVAFRTAALAAGSRLEPGAFGALVAPAVIGTEQHRRQLLSALDSVLPLQVQGAIEAATRLLEVGTSEAKANAATALGRLCRRDSSGTQAAAVLRALTASRLGSVPDIGYTAQQISDFMHYAGLFLSALHGPRAGSDGLPALWGALIATGIPWRQLEAATVHILEMHLDAACPLAVRMALLRDLVHRPLHSGQIGLTARLVWAALPASLDFVAVSDGTRDVAAGAHCELHGWRVVWGKTAGMLALSDASMAARIVEQLLYGDAATLGFWVVAATESVRQGGGTVIASRILASDPSRMASHAENAFVSLLHEFSRARHTGAVDAGVLDEVLRWGALRGIVLPAPTSDSRTVGELLEASGQRVSRAKAWEASNRLLARSSGDAAVPYLGLVALLKSPFRGVRSNAVRAMAAHPPDRVSAEDVAALVAALDEVGEEALDQDALRTIGAWADRGAGSSNSVQYVPDALGEWMAGLIPRHRRQGRLPNGLAYSLISAMTSVARNEPPTAHAGLSAAVAALLEATDLRKANNAENAAAVLLPAMHRRDPFFIDRLVDIGHRLPRNNVVTVAIAVAKCLGNNSPSLDRLARAAWCTPESLDFIIKIRGG